MSVTKSEFQRYEDVRHSGITNMFHVSNVCELAGLSREKVLEIRINYGSLASQYPEITALRREVRS